VPQLLSRLGRRRSSEGGEENRDQASKKMDFKHSFLRNWMNSLRDFNIEFEFERLWRQADLLIARLKAHLDDRFLAPHFG
jgi:predicted TIM-barrel fold metal-dependent hydrolase